MARIDLKTSQIGSFGTGDLQLQNGAAMDATLRLVTDAVNTASPLKLSTALVQSTSTVKITTSDVAYIDAEDNSGNNRFTVSRASASQLVTVDFASVPTALTTPVGAIRTATDGVNLANVMTFLENGKIGLGTDTPTAKLTVSGTSEATPSSTTGGILNVLGSSTNALLIGSLSASPFGMYIQGGGSATYPLILNPNGANVGVGTTSPTAKLEVKGSGTTSATLSLLVQNSAGNRILECSDDRVTQAFDLRISAENTYINHGFALTSQGAGIGRIASYAGAFGFPAGVIGIGTRIVVSNTTDVANVTSVNSSILEVKSTTQGFLPPRMTTAQKNAIATPDAGLIVYDSTLNKLCVYTTAWETITSV